MAALRGVGPLKLCEAGSARVIGLDLDQRAADTIDQQGHADEIARDIGGGAGEEGCR